MILELVKDFCTWGFSGIFNFLVWYISGVIVAAIINIILNKLLLKPDERGDNFYEDLEMIAFSSSLFSVWCFLAHLSVFIPKWQNDKDSNK